MGLEISDTGCINETQVPTLNEVVEKSEAIDNTAALVTESLPEQNTEIPPCPGDENWSDYVMKQFNEDELVDGNPNVDGLRRVTVKVLGDIIKSVAHTVQAPNPNNDWTATVEHHIAIKPHHAYYDELHFTEVSDVTSQNCDPEYRRHASSTASTRAEARALRKLLMLKRVVAAEELTEMPVITDSGTEGKISKNQINFIESLAKKNNINVMGYINLGSNKYEKIEDVPYQTALKMIGVLSEFQRNPGKIPAKIKGFDMNWRNIKS